MARLPGPQPDGRPRQMPQGRSLDCPAYTTPRERVTTPHLSRQRDFILTHVEVAMGWLSVGALIASMLYLGFNFLQKWWRPDHEANLKSGSAQGTQSKEEKSGKHNLRDADSDSEGDDTSPLTPKANGTANGKLPDVPTFNLEASNEDTPSNGTATAVSKTVPKPPSVSKGPTANKSANASTLMPPPTVKASALRPLPNLGSSLNPPPSAASRLRSPPNASLQPSPGLSAASASTLPPSKRPSRKVVLEPGHSPLDWAILTRNPPTTTFLRGEDIPPQLIKVSPSELKKRNGRKGNDAWGTWQGKVYNLTPYVKFHPGGVGEIMRGAGKPGESERLFNEIHPWVNWDNMLGECLVGILVSEPDITAENSLESVD